MLMTHPLFGGNLGNPATHWDKSVKGLGVRINGDGSSVYIIKYRHDGRQVMRNIASTEIMTLEQARKLVGRVKLLARSGDDPADLINNCLETEDINPASGITVERFSAIYMERHAREHKKSWRKDLRRIQRYLIPMWGKRALSTVRRAEVAEAHSRIGKHSKHEANRLRELVSKMFKLAIIWDYLPDGHPNPGWGIQDFRERSRDRFIRSHEMPILMPVITSYPKIYVKTALLLDLGTGMRVSELLSLRWDWVDLDYKEIRLPDTKAERPHIIPLSEYSMNVINSIPRIPGNPFVFPGRTRGSKLSRIDIDWRKIRAKAGLNDLNLHDLRRTVGCSIIRKTGSLRMVGVVLNQTTDHVKRVYAHYELGDIRTALDLHSEDLGRYL